MGYLCAFKTPRIIKCFTGAHICQIVRYFESAKRAFPTSYRGKVNADFKTRKALFFYYCKDSKLVANITKCKT